MDITMIYAEIQINPRNIVAYRQLAEHYKNCNRPNEADAFLELIRRMWDADSANTHKKQQQDDQELHGVPPSEHPNTCG